MHANGRNGAYRRTRRRLLIGAAAAVLVTAVLGLRSLRTHAPLDPDRLATIERGSVARSVVATGRIRALAEVEVKSKASGIVKELLVDYGDRVRRGQVLVELDKEEVEARVREAQAALMGAEASLERTRVEAEGPDLPFLRSGMERARQLFRDGLLAASAREEAEKAYELALNRQAVARRSVAVNRAEVERARAALERARNDLRYATVRSPMDGLVLSRDVEVGDAVSSILVLGSQATLVMRLGDVSSVYVLGKVDEADIGKVRPEQPARITVEAFKDRVFEGRVTRIAPRGEEKDNVTTFEVRVSVDNPGGELRVNMSANAEIIREEKQGVLLVPESAVIYDRDRRTFLEVPDARAESGTRRVAVKLGISNGVKTELLDGPREGAQVVLQ